MRDEIEHQLWRDEVDAMAWAYRDAGMLPPSKRVCGNGVDIKEQDPSTWGWLWAASQERETLAQTVMSSAPIGVGVGVGVGGTVPIPDIVVKGYCFEAEGS